MNIKMQTTTLGQVTVNHDKKRVPIKSSNRERVKGKYPYYGAQGIVDYVDDYIFDGKFLLVAEDGENLRSQNSRIVNLVTGKFWVNNHAHILQANSKASIDYLYYYLSEIDISPMITGSAQPKLTKENLESIKIEIPEDVGIQNSIAKALSMLDEKIALNNKINAELERTARLIYDYWFTQFDFPDAQGKPYKSSGGAMVYNDQLKRKIPESWDADNFSKYFRILSGFPFKSNTYDARGSYKVVTIKNVKDDEVDTSNADRTMNIPDNLPNYCKLSVGDLLISLTGNVGRIAPVSEDNLLLNQRVGKLQPVSKISKEYASLLLKRPEQAKRIQLYANGSSQANLSPIQAVDFIAVIPNDDILDRFQKIVEPLFNSIITNRQESAKLAELRDWLLPMLMNGQVKVV